MGRAGRQRMPDDRVRLKHLIEVRFQIDLSSISADINSMRSISGIECTWTRIKMGWRNKRSTQAHGEMSGLTSGSRSWQRRRPPGYQRGLHVSLPCLLSDLVANVLEFQRTGLELDFPGLRVPFGRSCVGPDLWIQASSLQCAWLH